MKKFASLLIVPVMLVQLFLLVPSVFALDPDAQAGCEAIGFIQGAEGCEDPNDSRSLSGVLELAVGLFSILLGFAAVVMIIIGGFKYVTANGDSGSIQGAKNTILYALIGLIVAAMAQVLVQFVFKQATTPPPKSVEASLEIEG